MENLVWVIYLIDVLCSGWGGLGLILFVLGSGSSILYVAGHFDEDLTEICERLPIKSTTVVCVVLLLLGNLIPTKETAYKMLLAYGAVEVVQNEDVQEVFGDGLDILKLTIKEYKDELESKE